jgi:phospholipase C
MSLGALKRTVDRLILITATQAEGRMGAREGIEHVVVLMLENRSFDCMFGMLYPKSAGFEGLSGAESNPWHRPDGTVATFPVWNDDGMGPASATIPDPDPGELFHQDINVQLFGLGGTPNDAPTPMSGFVDSYMRQKPGDPQYDPMAVMHYFTPQQVPVISALAKAFGVSDQWHASAPCQTWPNRFFAHTATAGGYVDNMPTRFPYQMPTIQRLLARQGRSWRIYFHDIAQSSTLADLWLEAATHFRFFDDEFAEDVSKGTLPNYSFIEPRYFTDRLLQRIPNDEHPPHNVVYGEQLIASVYNSLRKGPLWKNTLLIITHDEHGGCYDHVPPPRAAPPGPPYSDGFAFDRYGVRVPTVIVSPYMAPGSIVRAAPGGLKPVGPPYPFDHSSIIATLRRLFDLGDPLTGRDAVAPDLIGALSLDQPDNDGPAEIIAADFPPPVAAVEKAASAPPNKMQQALCRTAAHLPIAAAEIGTHISALSSGTLKPSAPLLNEVGEAANYVAARMRSFLGR